MRDVLDRPTSGRRAAHRAARGSSDRLAGIDGIADVVIGRDLIFGVPILITSAGIAVSQRGVVIGIRRRADGSDRLAPKARREKLLSADLYFDSP